MNVEMEKLVPRFLMDEPTTHGLANAIGAALKILCEGVQDGIDAVLDVEKMPEWRLDEMAWELSCLYDYSADVESKRAWIRDARETTAYQGTAEAIRRYLKGMFARSDVEEAGAYGGEPFHFRVLMNGRWDAESMAWAARAVARGKNVRSVMDTYVETFSAGIEAGAATLGARPVQRRPAWDLTLCGAEEI